LEAKNSFNEKKKSYFEISDQAGFTGLGCVRRRLLDPLSSASVCQLARFTTFGDQMNKKKNTCTHVRNCNFSIDRKRLF